MFEQANIFESMILQMLGVDEVSGRLDEMLEKITVYYKFKFDSIIDNLSSVIESIILAVLCGLVLLLALGIFMSM